MRIYAAVLRPAVLCGALAVLSTSCTDQAAVRRNIDAGDRFFKGGRYAEAILEFRNAVERDERSGEARFKLGEAYGASGEFEKAFREYLRAADLLPDDPRAQLKAATYLLMTGQFEDAKSRVVTLLEKDPKNVEALVILGNALAGLRDLAGALAQLNEAVALEPGRSQTHANVALLEMAQGRRHEAKAAFERAVQTDPKSVSAHLGLANFLWSVGEVAAAEQSLQTAYKLDAKDLLTNRALATFYVSSGRAASAETYLKAVASSSAASQLELADYYISMRRVPEAIRVLEPLTAQTAVASAAEARLAGLAYISGQTLDAHARIDKLLRREPNNAFALLLKARWLMTEGRYERALVRATSAVAANPRLVAAHYIRGQLQAATHRTGDAIKSYGEVLRLNARAAIAQVQLSRLHLARHNIDSAVIAAEEALRNAPDSVDARLALTRAWIARKDLGRAAVALDEMRRRAPDTAEVHALDGALRLINGDVTRARAAFQRALALDPADIEALTGLAGIDIRQGRLDEVRAHVNARLSASPENAELLVLAAKVFIASGDRVRGEQSLRKAIDLDPLETESFVLLGRLFADAGRVDAALREFDELAKQQPKNVAPRLMSAMLVHAQGHLEDAKARYEAILLIEPRTTIAANNLAALYVDAGENLDVAERWAATALEQMPSHAGIHDTLGMVYYRRHRFPEALQRFRQSATLEPDNPVYRYHLALVYHRNGEIERAKEHLRLALDRNPDYAEARQLLASLLN